MPASQPNILLIITHDTGTHLGCYGKRVDTPHLNRLAGEGIRFDRYFCTAPQCSPSRSSILTGRHPHENGCMGLVGGGWALPDDAETLPKVLRRAGYETWLWGFQHENEERPEALGYDHDPIDYQRGDVPKILARHVTPLVCDWLRARPAGPWFASVGFFETHIPFGKRPVPADEPDRIEPLPYLPDSPGLRQDVAELQGDVREMDHHVGRILETLDEAELSENTILLFTTDHGIAFPRAKCSLYDPGVNTALLMRWPGVFAANRVVGDLLSNIDLLPTLAELAGAAVPDGVSGRSFAGLLRGGAYTPREAIFTELTYHSEYDPTRSLRTHRYKFIRHWDPIPGNLQPSDYWTCCAGAEALSGPFSRPWPERELYDLAADPNEQHNLVGLYGYDALAGEMEERLLAWMRETGDPLLDGPVEVPGT